MKQTLFPALCALSLLTAASHGDVLLKFNKPDSTSAFTFEGSEVSLHEKFPHLTNDGNGNDGPNSGAVNISVAPGGTGAAILSSGYSIEKTDVGKTVSATVWHYRSGPNSFADVALALLLDGKVVGTETAKFPFSREAADAGAEPTKTATGDYVIQAGDVGKKLSLRFRSVSTNTKNGASYAIDAVTFVGVGAKN